MWARIAIPLLSRKTPGKKLLLFDGIEDEAEMEGPSNEVRGERERTSEEWVVFRR